MILAALWKNDLRHFLILLNFIAIFVVIAYLVNAVLSPRRARKELERSPANLTPFLEDDDLETRRLERVLGWALLFAAVVAVSLPLYWLREPTRQEQSASYFDENAVERGATLFAKRGDPAYNSAVSKGCAQCHGSKGEGGNVPFRIEGEPVSWQAPALNTELLRLRQDELCVLPAEARPSDTVCKVSDIIIYGRPGTPMAGWGVAGGGPLNNQAVTDLVAYIRSIQLTPEQVKQQAEADLVATRSNDPNVTCPKFATCPAINVALAQKTLDAANTSLAEKRTALLGKLGIANASDADLESRCDALAKSIPDDPAKVDETLKEQAKACTEFLTAVKKQTEAQAAYDWSLEWERRRANVSEGQVLFEINCARCHTQGWSVFDSTKPPGSTSGVDILGLPGGGGGVGGGIGFNLRDGATQRRFGTDEDGGFDKQVEFVRVGSLPFKAYGINGMGSGKMPGYADSLTDDQIKKIVRYERECLSVTDYKAVSPACETPPAPKVPPTTTTVAGG